MAADGDEADEHHFAGAEDAVTVPATDTGSVRVVIIAMLANVGVTIAFAVAAVITGSTSMLAQTVHGAADTGNQAILWVAQRHSRSSTTLSRIEAGRAAYFWALLAAIGIFVVGGTVSVREGINGLVHPEPADDFGVAYAVLVVALLLDGFSWSQAVRETHTRAVARDLPFFDQLVGSSDPTTRAVFGEDSAAIIGDFLAMAGIALHQLTGSSIPDALGSIAIGLLLIGLAVFLARRNLDFLVGQSPPESEVEAVRAFLRSHAAIDDVDELLVTFVGPRQLWIVARVDVDDDLSAVELTRVTADIERELRARDATILRVDLVPVSIDDPP